LIDHTCNTVKCSVTINFIYKRIISGLQEEMSQDFINIWNGHNFVTSKMTVKIEPPVCRCTRVKGLITTQCLETCTMQVCNFKKGHPHCFSETHNERILHVND